jgi:hypothetical protein
MSACFSRLSASGPSSGNIAMPMLAVNVRVASSIVTGWATSSSSC